MGALYRQILLIGLILLACGQSAFGETYSDPSGFSFTYPEGWIAVTQKAMGDVNQIVPDDTKEWVLKNNVDLSQIAVTVIRDGNEEFLENLNVVVKPQQIPVNDKFEKELKAAISQQLGTMGVKLEGVQSRIEKIGSRDAIVVTFQSRLPGVDDLLRQKQIMLPGGGNTYIITCTAKADSFDKYQPTFDAVLASFQAPAPATQGFVWNQAAVSGAIGGVVGGMIAALALAKRSSSGKSKAKPESPTASEADEG
jgi:hypothetical protein